MSLHFRPTKIVDLHVQGFRSLRDVRLEGLEDIVVLHGPNGVGKSNLLRAVRLPLRWMSLFNVLPSKMDPYLIQKNNSSMMRTYDVKESDFTLGGDAEIRISLNMELGTFQTNFLGKELFEQLVCAVVAQDHGHEIAIWFEAAALSLPGGRELALLRDQQGNGNFARMVQLHKQLAQLEMDLREDEYQLAEKIAGAQKGPSYPNSRSSSLKGSIEDAKKELEKLEDSLEKLEDSFVSKDLILPLVRAQSLLFPRLLLHSSAYRDGYKGFSRSEKSHFDHHLVAEDELLPYLVASQISPDRRRRALVGHLSKLLAKAGFAQKQVSPVFDGLFQTYDLYIDDVPLSQMGTGRQQLVWVLGKLFANDCAVVMIEEPEAHLHKEMMLSLAEFFQDEMRPDGPKDDFVIHQLWLETHHHAFALSPRYLDVSLDAQGHTVVHQKERSQALKHFYEPGPFWEAMRKLLEDVYDKSDVAFQGVHGPVTFGELEASVEGDRRLANEYAEAMTEMVILGMRKKAKKAG